MRRIFVLLLVVQAWGLVVSQSPEAMSFQAVIRDANSALLQNDTVGIQISILQGSVGGLATYIERHTPTTNDNGLATLEIGNGMIITGDFSSIDWSNGPYFLKTETDLSGGTSYTIADTSQFLSIPYALYSAFTDSIVELDPVFGSSVAAGITLIDTANWNDDLVDDADADPGNEIQSISLQGDTLSISGGNSLVLPYDSSIWHLNNDTVFYNGGNVGIGTSSPAAKLEVDGDFIRRINYASNNGPADQTDVGRIISRSLTFTKKRGDTKIRISYTDNLRNFTPSGGGRACRWEIRVDSLPCPNQPLVYDYYNPLQFEDTHRSRTVVGYCDGLGAGTHQIQIWVGQTPGIPLGDCNTGWNNSTWVIEVEEVF